MRAILKIDFDPRTDTKYYTIYSDSLPMKRTALSVEHDGNHIGSAKVDSVSFQKGTLYSLYLEWTFGSSLDLPDGLYSWQKLVA